MEDRGETGAVKVAGQGFRAHGGEPGMGPEVVSGDEPHEAEPTGIVIDDPPTGPGLEDHMVVPGIVAGCTVEAARLGGGRPLNAEPAAHPQVGDQGLAPVQVHEQVLGPAPQSRDPRPHETLDEAFGEGKPQIGPAGLHADEPLPLEDRRKAPADGFDFRQFRHGVCVAWSGQRGNRAAGPAPGIRAKPLSRRLPAF